MMDLSAFMGTTRAELRDISPEQKLEAFEHSIKHNNHDIKKPPKYPTALPISLGLAFGALIYLIGDSR